MRFKPRFLRFGWKNGFFFVLILIFSISLLVVALLKNSTLFSMMMVTVFGLIVV